MLKESRVIEVTKVFNLCRKERFYTMGTTEEYSNLLENLCGGLYNHKVVTTKDIEIIAKDIYNHSDIEYFEKRYGGNWSNFEEGMIEHIAFNLINDCCYTSVEYIK